MGHYQTALGSYQLPSKGGVMDEKEEEIVQPKRVLDNWQVRRLFMLIQMLFCKLVIGYCIYNNMDSRVAEGAVDMSFFLMGTIILAYVFGATWEDISKMKLRR